MRATPRFAEFLILSVLPFSMFGLAQAPAASPQTSSPKGLELLHKMQVALGGADRIAAIQDYEESVTAQVWNNAGNPMGEVRKRTRWMRDPNLLRLDQKGPRDTYVLYFDGGSQSGWEMLPDLKAADKFKTVGESIELVGGELKFAQNYISGFQLKMWLADRVPGYMVTSPAPNVVRIAHDGTANDLTLDPSSWLPLKTAGVSLADPDHPVSSESRIEGWTQVAGVLFPTHRANFHEGVKMAEETTEGSIRINTGLRPQDLAAKPADFAPYILNR